ncbi:MAG: hypothetical protein Ta2B_06270 [Termitinemataceae bacterium]|nr:MAG: hypothetical protein Ta2B_06270 [Termitinemataceae bacterium]
MPKIDNDTEIIISAGIYFHKNKLIDKGVGLIDSIIIMHGIKTDSKIWTLDTIFFEAIPSELIYTAKI